MCGTKPRKRSSNRRFSPRKPVVVSGQTSEEDKRKVESGQYLIVYESAIGVMVRRHRMAENALK